MCWNANVSLCTFVLGACAAIVSYVSGVMTPTSVAFFMSFVSMQLLEFFLWRNLDVPATNHALSTLGFAIILSQPIFSWLCAPASVVRTVAIAIYSVFAAGACVRASVLTTFRTVVARNGHLDWKWLHPRVATIVVWMAFFAGGQIWAGSWLPAAFILVSAAISYYCYARDGTFGSMWCFVANVASVYFIGKSFVALVRTCPMPLVGVKT